MLPKPSSQKSQFRTPFRDPSLSSCGFPLSQSQDPLLACTPSFTIDCSQMSTPGITVDTLQSLIRKSPKQLNGPKTLKNKIDRLKSQTANNQVSREITGAKNREPNLAGGTCKRKDPGISINVTQTKSQIHKTASNGTSHRDTSVSTVGKENISVRQSAEHVTNSSVNPVQETVPCKSGSSRGQRRDKDPSSNRSKETSSTPVVYKSKSNCRAASSRSILPKNTIVKPTPFRKFSKHVTKNKATPMHRLLNKHYNQRMPPSDLTIAKTPRRGSTPDGIDNVVVVREEEYVYRDPPQDRTVSNTKASDVYTFTSTSPEKTSVGGPQAVTRKRRNEQVRMDVLREIYRIETELAVLRKRRKNIRMRLNTACRGASVCV